MEIDILDYAMLFNFNGFFMFFFSVNNASGLLWMYHQPETIPTIKHQLINI